MVIAFPCGWSLVMRQEYSAELRFIAMTLVPDEATVRDTRMWVMGRVRMKQKRTAQGYLSLSSFVCTNGQAAANSRRVCHWEY